MARNKTIISGFLMAVGAAAAIGYSVGSYNSESETLLKKPVEASYSVPTETDVGAGCLTRQENSDVEKRGNLLSEKGDVPKSYIDRSQFQTEGQRTERLLEAGLKEVSKTERYDKILEKSTGSGVGGERSVLEAVVESEPLQSTVNTTKAFYEAGKEVYNVFKEGQEELRAERAAEARGTNGGTPILDAIVESESFQGTVDTTRALHDAGKEIYNIFSEVSEVFKEGQDRLKAERAAEAK